MQLKTSTLLQGGKYRIEKVLGQGGFGITYLATQELLDRKVCIKEFFFKEYCERDEAGSHVTLGTQSNREVVERFMNKFIKEARTIAQLDHRNIIRIHDIFKENNTAYYVMDYIEGESLNEMVTRRGALPENEAVVYIDQVAGALNYIHQQNINHLDIKPSNIMIRQRDCCVILIDFGLSKQYDEQGGQTSSTPVGISHGYAPMEQYKLGGVSTFSPQTDIYSLGATLYKLVTGNTPPQAMDLLDEELPDMPENVSGNVQNAIKQAMEARKKKRPQNINEFLALLKTSSTVVCDVKEDAEDLNLLATTVSEFHEDFAIENEAIHITEETLLADSTEMKFLEFHEILRSKGVEISNNITAVDLGLSVKWANMNIGSKCVADRGDLYNWGETSKASITDKLYSDNEPIPFDIAGTKYDIVTQQVGNGWCVPTIEQWNELKDECEWEWIEHKAAKGYIVKGKNQNCIFLPTQNVNDNYGYYWASNRSRVGYHRANYFFFSGGIFISESLGAYYIGRTIRGIKK